MEWKTNDVAWVLENNMRATQVKIVRPMNGRYIVKIDNGGGTVIAISSLFICTSFVFLLVEVWCVNALGKTIDDALQDAVYRNVTTNYDEIYDGAKNGVYVDVIYNASRDGFDYIKDYGDIYSGVANTLGLTRNGNKLCKENNYCL